MREENQKTVSEIAHAWWESLRKRDKGGRARLRRCHKLEDVMVLQPYVVLASQLGSLGVPAENIAAIAGLLSHVKDNVTGTHFTMGACLAGRASGSERAVLSGLRMRKLLACDDVVDAYRDLIRAIKLSRGVVPVHDLVQSVQWWNQRTRQKWAADYYSAVPQEL